MHQIRKNQQTISRANYNNIINAGKMGDNIANHLAYIYMIILYDKFGMSFKKLCNFNEKLISLREKWQNDDDETVTSDTLIMYCLNKGIDGNKFVKSIPMSKKLFLADMKGKGALGADRHIEAAFLKTILLTVQVLKENYRFSNAKIEEFFEWVRYGIDCYVTKLPKEKGFVWSDEYIRQAFIEDEGWDITHGVNAS